MIKENFSEIRWGIIGAGDVCEVKSGPAFNRIEHSKIVAVMRRDKDKAKDFAFRHNVPKWYSDASKLINDPEVNAIYIATPPSSHCRYTVEAAKAGKPIYVEKPMARNYTECTEMVNACNKAKVPLFVAYYRRRLPYFLKIEALIKENSIGSIRYVNINLNKTLKPDIVGASSTRDNWRILPEISGGGYFYDLASHQLDFLDYLFGPIIEANGFALNQAGLYPAEDVVSGSFRFENGIIGQGIWCFTVSESSDSEVTRIVGSHGEIIFSYFGSNIIQLKRAGKVEKEFIIDSPRHIQEPLIQTIVDQLRGSGQCPSTGVSGARTNQAMGWLCRSIT